MDAMLIERDRKLSEKEAYIVHLQTALSGDQSTTPTPAPAQVWTQHQHYTEELMSTDSCYTESARFPHRPRRPAGRCGSCSCWFRV